MTAEVIPAQVPSFWATGSVALWPSWNALLRLDNQPGSKQCWKSFRKKPNAKFFRRCFRCILFGQPEENVGGVSLHIQLCSFRPSQTCHPCDLNQEFCISWTKCSSWIKIHWASCSWIHMSWNSLMRWKVAFNPAYWIGARHVQPQHTAGAVRSVHVCVDAEPKVFILPV